MKHRPRRSHPHDERGVAMFIVMMLIVMVSAAGIFVARSTSLEIRSAGYVRQAGQTHYLTESGVATILARMRSNCTAYFTEDLRRRAITNSITAVECPPVATSRGPVTAPCYRFNLSDFTSPTVFATSTGCGTGRVEGSFGVNNINPSFQVTVTELSVDTAPQRGSDVTSASLVPLPVRFEISALGQTEISTTGYSDPDNVNVARGTESARAIAVIQCN